MMGEIRNNKSNDKTEVFEHHLDSAFSNMSVPQGIGKEAAWGKLVNAVETREQEKNVKTIRLANKPLLSVAASVVFVFLSASIYYLFFLKVDVFSGYAQITKYSLPDNSSVVLNAGSTIRLKKHGWINNRHVYLEGEAFFKVLPGSKFTVATNHGIINVVGTSFNVYSRKSHFVVSCETGEVRVNVPHDGYSTSIKAGKGLKVDLEGESISHEIFEVKSIKPSAWLSGDFYFDNTPLIEVIEEIERQYDVKIYADGLGGRHYTGYFRKGDLKQTLDVVCIPMNLNYLIKNNKSVYIE